MDHQDRQAIEQLFGKIAQVEGQAGAPDAQAAEFIRSRITQQPNAPYYMAQTIVVQEQALSAAHGRIQQLEQELASRPAGGGGFLSGLFGGGQTRPQPHQPYQPQPMHGMPPHGAPGMGGVAPGMAPCGGGSFLAGAAQTAMGVAGGVLLGNMFASAFSGGGEANAAEAGQTQPQQAAAEDFGDDGGDFGFEEDI
ncbi:DUF2076 domain-containing protein [Microvirga sp. 3-52]|jgi:hypothetical protein|uniref:DUF2076 domain-containing protein n=1 Tax=Microvirga sp. 3-52 TaxID=2792425 RepID=UPI001AC40F15|nr:DUF2076 domain-containing protein [Microvirga sp. 3-52]MBO1909083.1 DUF2076 domain-containing protein [Microvirga sp. 3-52]MBS7455333.1 DUF2076 domain-containing protein [Microvirga sp. 3-52]